MANDQKKYWYVLKAIGGKEKKTKENIENEVQRRGLQDLFGQVVVPVEKVYQQRNGKKVLKEHILYSGYVFVECILNNETQAVLLSVQNVLGFLTCEYPVYGKGKKEGESVLLRYEQRPQEMRYAEVSRMIGRMDEVADDTTEDEVPFTVGETVKVTDGSFSGFSGEIEEVNEEKKKLSVMIKIFGRKTPLELSYFQVEKE